MQDISPRHLRSTTVTRLALVGGGPAADAYARSAHRLTNARVSATAGAAPTCAGSTLTVATLSELLQSHANEFDSVVLQTPINQRADDVKAIALAGKHVLVECPIAHSAADAHAAIDACSDAGVTLLMGQMDRYRPDTLAVRASMSEGHIGQPGLVRSHRWQPSRPHETDVWEFSPKVQEGIFVEELTRDIDIASWLFEAPPTDVFAISRSLGDDPPDWAVVHLGFSGGGMAVLEIAICLPQGDGYRSLELIGDNGAAYIDDQYNMQLLYSGGSPSARLTEQGDAAAIGQLQAFTEAIECGSDPNNSARASVLALEVAEAASASAATGQPASRTNERYILVQ